MVWLRAWLLLLPLLAYGASPACAQNYQVQVDPGKEKPKAEQPASPPAATAPAGPLAAIKRSDDDLVLVDIIGGGQTLAQGVTGYVSKGSVMLPLGQLTEALEFPIKVSVREGIAHGWSYKEDNLFSLDMARREVVLAGKAQPVDAALAELHDDDIYVDVATLGSWFSLKLNFSFATQTVTIEPQNGVHLPFELAAERERRQSKLGDKATMEKVQYPQKNIPYAFATLPFLDISGQVNYTNKETSESASVLATSDLLYMQNNMFANVTDKKGLSDLRMTLSRHSPDGKLFAADEALGDTWLGETSNALQLRSLELGDVNSQQLPLTARGQSGRGVTVSNMPTNRATDFNRTTLEGDILPDWEVELYRNDELLNFQKGSANGHYEFTDVPLLSGANIIRLVFYGPHGETREEVQRILVRSEITSKGESYFRMSSMQQNSSLLQVREQAQQQRPLASGSLPTKSESDNMEGKMRSAFEYEYGLADNIALYSSLAQIPLGTGEEASYATIGTGASYFGVFGRFDAATSNNGGAAYQGNIQTNLYGVTLSAKHLEFRDFLSDYTGTRTDPIKRQSEARADMPVGIYDLPNINVGISDTRVQYESGRSENEITQRMSTYILRFLQIGNDLSRRTSYNVAAADTTTTQGNFTLGMPLWDMQLRGQVGYDISPQGGLNTIQLSSDYNIDENLSLRGSVSRDTTTSFTTYELGTSHNFQHVKVGLNTSYSSDHTIAAFLNFGFSLGHKPDSGWAMSYKEAARDGMVSARVYLDKNNNGMYDEGDELIPGATLQADSGGRSVTDKNGVALLQGLRSEAQSNVTLEEASLENAYWVVKDKGYTVTSRAGVPVALDFAVVESGDIEGDIFIESADGKQEIASNVVIQLVDDKGEVLRETRSSFDGYYLMDRVAVGSYHLRVSPDQLKRRNLVSGDDIAITLKAEGSIKQKFTLKPGPENAAPEVDHKPEPDAVAAPVAPVEKTDPPPPAPEEKPEPVVTPTTPEAKEEMPPAPAQEIKPAPAEPAHPAPPAPERRKRFPPVG